MSGRTQFTPIQISDLVPFKNHPFKLYEGKRLTDMIESIKANNIMSPIIVRPIANDKYEILSGHNRTKAAGMAGLEAIPAVIRDNLTDEEALLIVTETNLLQRSFADMLHSERAIAIATHYEAIKMKPGYRSDLTESIIEQTLGPLDTRLSSREKIGEKHGLSATTVSRYLRINRLIPKLKDKLDYKRIGLRVADTLSHLRPEEQAVVESILDEGRKISIKKAQLLRDESAIRPLASASIRSILKSEDKPKDKKTAGLDAVLSKHFSDEHSPDEINQVIDEALEMYYSARGK